MSHTQLLQYYVRWIFSEGVHEYETILKELNSDGVSIKDFFVFLNKDTEQVSKLLPKRTFQEQFAFKMLNCYDFMEQQLEYDLALQVETSKTISRLMLGAKISATK